MELKDLETTCERKEGVELLRIISMLMIIAIYDEKEQVNKA